MTAAVPQCRAVVSEPPHYFHKHRCPNPGKHEIGGVHVCGTHLRVARRWDAQGRLATMVEHWWPAVMEPSTAWRQGVPA